MEVIVMDNDTPRPRNELSRAGKADDRSLPAATRDKIAKGLENINEANISKALIAIFGQVELSADVIKYIQRGTVYLAEVPKKLQKDFIGGRLKFMEKSTGEMVGEIVGPNNFGNRGHVIIKDAGVFHSNIPHDLTTIAMQQQLKQMAAVLDEVRSRVVELQKTYDGSLLGELRGMRDQLAQVQSIDDLENQRDLVKGAITQLNLTRGKITDRLIEEMKKIPEVPRSGLSRLIKTITHEGFRERVVSGYEKTQELFGYYLTASELLAYAYALLGESGTYENIFSPDGELLMDSSLENLKQSEKILGICDERWYSSPNKYLGRIKREAQKVFLSKPESITIEITGDQIMEAIESVGSEKERENGKTGSESL